MVARQPSLKLVGAAANGLEALELARRLRPELVLLDLEMPVMDGLEATVCLGRECPAARVVVVTIHDTPELRRLCCRQGAYGFVAKDALEEELPMVVLGLFGEGE